MIWPGIYLLWWLGLIGALRLCIALSRGKTEFGQIKWWAALLCLGLIGAVLFNVEGHDPNFVLPMWFAFVPYATLICLGYVQRTISNSRSAL